MELFQNMTQEERKLLISAPIYISLLVATHDGAMNEEEKKAAQKHAHLKTFTADSVLSDYYKEVEGDFYEKIDELYNKLPQDAAEREISLREKIGQVESLLSKHPDEEAKKLLLSLESYSWHVSQSHKNISEDFIIPLRIKGLTA